MKPEWRRFAPIGFYIAVAALFITAGLYVVFREFNLYMQIGTAIIVLGIAVSVFLDPGRVKELLTGRQARYGSNVILLSIAFIGIIVVLNVFVYNNSHRWDLTEDKTNTLADETLETLKSLPEKVTAVAFYSPNKPSDQARNLLDLYKYYSDGKFDYKFVDPLSDPVAAQEAGVTKDGTIVFTMGDRQETSSLAYEREITSALVRLMSEEGKKVYFLSGHGEFTIENTGARNENYSQVAGILRKKNYEVDELNLLISNEVPDDASVVVIAGPLNPLSEDEVNLIKDYLDRGGSLIVMEEPIPVTQFDDKEDYLVAYLADEWGITLGRDIVVDPTSMQPFVAYADQYGYHVITDRMQRVGTAYPTARSVQVERIDGINTVELVKTSPKSWGETNFESLNDGEKIKRDEDVDLLGPVTIAAVADKPAVGSRVAVFGDSNFATGQNYDFLGNGDMLINTVDWAAGQEGLIDLTVKTPTQRILLPPAPYLMNLILLGLVFVLPGLMLISGIVVWVQRKRRG